MQRFWLTNRSGMAIEVEQWGAGGTQLQQPLVPLAAGNARPGTGRGRDAGGTGPAATHPSRARPGFAQFCAHVQRGLGSGFPIDVAGRFVVHCEQGVRPDEDGWWDSLVRVMVHVQLIGACIEVSFIPAPPSPAPYRIDNRTPCLFVCRQKGAEHRAHVVQPMSKAPFAWAESSLDRVLWSLNPVRPGVVAHRPRDLACSSDGSRRGGAGRRQGQRAWGEPRRAPAGRLDAMMRSVQLTIGDGGVVEEAVVEAAVEVVEVVERAAMAVRCRAPYRMGSRRHAGRRTRPHALARARGAAVGRGRGRAPQLPWPFDPLVRHLRRPLRP